MQSIIQPALLVQSVWLAFFVGMFLGIIVGAFSTFAILALRSILQFSNDGK